VAVIFLRLVSVVEATAVLLGLPGMLIGKSSKVFRGGALA
jgi:hypothetical protein